MTDDSITLEPASGGRIDRVESLLDANGLPSADVREKPECFFLAVTEAGVVGVGGVEPAGSDGLLRSVVVTEASRGQGYGTALCTALEDYARTSGLEELYLLTTTATGFFRGRGYERIERDRVPPEIRETREFAELCPDAATCMYKRL